MMNKRILSFLLAVMLIVGLMPTSVFATENEGEPAPNPVIEPAGDGEDADGITPLTEEDEDIVPQNGEGEDGEDAEPCTVCNEPGCEKTHTQCEACGTWDCEKTHTQCEVCDAWDCTEHKPCDLCGAYDCGGEHEYCTECDKYNCGIDHNAACDKCGVPGCTAEHKFCDTCSKYDCGIDHSVTSPSEPENDDTEELPLSEKLLAIQDLEILYEEAFSYTDEISQLTKDELIALREHTESLYSKLETPTSDNDESREMLVELFNLYISCPDCGELEGHTEECPRNHFSTPVDPALYAHISNHSGDEPLDVGGLEMDKHATKTNDGYRISLEAWTSGEVIHGTTGNKVDIILVLDMSNQMKTGNRFAEMKEAATSFINSSITTDGSRRIAVVTYNNSAAVQSGSKTDNDAALVSVTPESAVTLNSIVNALSNPTGHSNIDQGMTKAAHIFQDGNSKVPSDRQRYVILLSAGVFGSGNLINVEGKDHTNRTKLREQYVEDQNVGQRGLWIGNIIKTSRGTNANIQESGYFNSNVKVADFKKFFGTNFAGCGAKMYCVGIGMPKAVLGVGTTYGDFKANYKDGTAFWKNYGVLGTMINEIMYRMSSHRPDSTHVGGSQYNSWEQDWKNLMNANGYSSWPAPHGFWEGHYWDNYTRNIGDNFGGTSYFITTDDAADLSGIFNTINENIGKVTISLGSTTILKDIVKPYFDMPEIPQGGNVKSIVKAYTMDYNGTDFVESTKTDITDSVTISMDRDARTVTVTGYNYDDNYITTEGRGTGSNLFYGKKLIVEFDITVTDDFMGGDKVLTNSEDSGIYMPNESKPIEKFPLPEINENVSEIEPITSVKNIYASQQAKLPEMMNIGKYEQNGGSWQIDGINNAYVDITYTAEELDANGDPTGNKISITIPAGTTYADMQALSWTENGTLTTHPLLKQDTTYRVTCDVVSINNRTGNKSSVSKDHPVLVYKPEITFQDSAINLGQLPNYATENQEANNVVWKHGDTVADITVMGAAPELIYTYDPAAAAFTQDTNVKVTVTSKGNGTNVPANMDVTPYTSFYRDACDYKTCDHKTMAQVAVTDDRINFVVHINTFDLTITKKGVERQDGNAPFVFRVFSKETGVDMKLVIYGNDSVTIKGLPAGTYTVTETDGYWRYDITQATPAKSQSITPKGTTAAVEFTNKRTEDKWLDDWAKATNDFGKTSASFGSGIAD